MVELVSYGYTIVNGGLYTVHNLFYSIILCPFFRTNLLNGGHSTFTCVFFKDPEDRFSLISKRFKHYNIWTHGTRWAVRTPLLLRAQSMNPKPPLESLLRDYILERTTTSLFTVIYPCYMWEKHIHIAFQPVCVITTITECTHEDSTH